MSGMPRQPEGKLVQKIKVRITSKGGRAFKIHGSDEGFQEVGIPDLLFVYLGRFVGAEVKQPGAELRPSQRRILHEIFNAGGVAAVLETVEQAAALLSYLEKEVVSESATGLCYDRGSISRSRCKFS